MILILSVIFQALMISYTTDDRVSLFNELMVSLYLYLLIGLTDYNETRAMKDSIGNALLYLVLFTVFVNALVALIRALRKAIDYIRRIP
jgi:hypothetical protein